MDASPFNRIPRELRDAMYEYAVVVPEGILLLVNDDNDICRKPSHDHMGTPRPTYLALPQCCKQLRSESLPIFYAQNTFSSDTREYRRSITYVFGRSVVGVKDWVDELDEHCKLLATVKINLGVCDPLRHTYTAMENRNLIIEYKNLFVGRHATKLIVETRSYCRENDEILGAIDLPLFDLERAVLNVEALACSQMEKQGCSSCRFVQRWLRRALGFLAA